MDPDTGDQIFGDEGNLVIPQVDDLKSLETWSHQNPVLLKAGRCSHIAPGGMPEEDVEAYMADLAEKDKTEERFRIISEDDKITKMDAW